MVFGIPVTVDPWFLLGLFLFYSISGGGRVGLFTALAIGVFVLIHELGHALVARRFGAVAEIRLGLLIGWASYSHPRGLARWQKNVISVAGPATEFVAAVLALWAIRLWVLPDPPRTVVSQSELASLASRVDLYHDLFIAVAWAGLTLALLNLLPLWPLDGGHVVASVIERWFGPRGLRVFLIWTVAASATMLIVGFSGTLGSSIDDWRAGQWGQALTAPLPEAVGRLVIALPAAALTSAVFIAFFCGLSAFQALQALRFAGGTAVPAREVRHQYDEQTARVVRTAERHGWEGTIEEFPNGWSPSPWLEAHVARRAAASPDQIAHLLNRLASDSPRWTLDRIERPEVGELLPLVPPGAALSERVLEARLFHGSAEDLVNAALAAYHGRDTAEPYYLVAEGYARRGLADDAMSWLRSAVDRSPDPRRMSTSPHLYDLHGRSDFQQLLGTAERAVRDASTS